MSPELKISVVIPVYNAAEYLSRSVDSILMQGFSDFEIILVNDGSTDDTVCVCERLSTKDKRIRLINKENGGVSSARNVGIDAARGEYIMFLDADDALRDGALERMYDMECDFVLAGFEKIVGTSSIESYCPSCEKTYYAAEQICDFFDEVLPQDNTYILNSACFKLFRRELLQNNNVRFVEGLSFAEDKLFVMTYLTNVEKVRTVPFVAYSYILRSGSLSSDMKSEAHAYQVFGLLDKYKPVITKLEKRYADSSRIGELYHRDFVGRYVCRILNILATGRSCLLTEENLSRLYGYIDADSSAGIFSFRIGQVPNMILYKIHRPALTKKFYCFTSWILG